MTIANIKSRINEIVKEFNLESDPELKTVVAPMTELVSLAVKAERLLNQVGNQFYGLWNILDEIGIERNSNAMYVGFTDTRLYHILSNNVYYTDKDGVLTEIKRKEP